MPTSPSSRSSKRAAAISANCSEIIYEDRDGNNLDAGVAETRGGKYVVYYDRPPGGGLDQFNLYDSIQEIEDEVLRAKADAVRGDGYEFLDI